MLRWIVQGTIIFAAITLRCGPARAANEGQADLDRAAEAKLSAQNLGDLAKVITLIDGALDKGLDPDNKRFAESLLASTLVERATVLAAVVFKSDPSDARSPQLRNVALADLERAVKIEEKQPEAHFLIARLNLLPGGDRQRAAKALDKTIEQTGDPKQKADALLLRSGLEGSADRKPADLNAAVRVAAEQSGQRWAILIGVDDYAEVRKLKYCGADQRALRDRLVASGFPDNQVFLLHDEAKESKYRPLKANIERQLDLVLKLVERNDLVVVGFSGHGVHLDGKSYLCPTEARLGDPKTLVSLDRVYEELNKCPASLKVVLVDACRNDPRPGGERSLAPTDETNRFAAALERPPQGILLLTSCAPGQISMEEEEFGHGVFMHYLLDGMSGKADVDRNDRVSLVELYKYVNQETKVYVARKFNGFQTPALKGTIDDDFDISRSLGLAKEITNSIGMKLILIPAGEFMMGSPEGDKGRESDEHPHRVRITKPFYLGAHEVTLGQFLEFYHRANYKTEAERDGKGGWGYTGDRESPFKQSPEYVAWNSGFPQTKDHPVVNVSWNDAVAFCEWLGRKEGKTYRLPTEAEWEYACRAGTTTRYYFGDDSEGLVRAGNVRDMTTKATFPGWTTESGSDGYVFTAPVGRFQPDPFGLYDMHGNVWEWCADWAGGDYYQSSPVDDPTGPASGSFRESRGGSWYDAPGSCRAANRNCSSPDYRSFNLGFRVALVPAGK
jgi:formylglycine-generating enzyme required for sulfatase activity